MVNVNRVRVRVRLRIRVTFSTNRVRVTTETENSTSRVGYICPSRTENNTKQDSGNRRLATGNVQCVCSATYQIFLGYRSRIRTPNHT